MTIRCPAVVRAVKGRHWPLENLVLLGNGDGTFQTPYPLGGRPTAPAQACSPASSIFPR
ncbi:MAG: hypothetical protein AB1635_11255 [Acidobacteriota bacterium]